MSPVVGTRPADTDCRSRRAVQALLKFGFKEREVVEAGRPQQTLAETLVRGRTCSAGSETSEGGSLLPQGIMSSFTERRNTGSHLG